MQATLQSTDPDGGSWFEANQVDSITLNAGADFSSDAPEPASLAMFGIGLAGLGFLRRGKPAE